MGFLQDWSDIQKDQRYWQYTPQERGLIKAQWALENIVPDPDFQSYDEEQRLTILNEFATFAGEQPDRTFWGTLKDAGISLGKGVVGAGEGIVGLTDIVTRGATGKGLEAAGVDFESANEALSQEYSPAQQWANERVDRAEGFIPTLAEMVKNPSTIAHSTIESAPSMIAGGMIGRGALKAAPMIGRIVAGAAGEGAVSAGSMAEQVRNQTPGGMLSPSQIAKSTAAGIGTGIFGVVGGRLAKRFGFVDPDVMLVQSGIKNTNTASIGRRIIEGGISEGVFEELPQSAQEQIWQNAATDKPLLEGVDQSAAQGLMAGAAMGAGFNARPQAKPNVPQIKTVNSLADSVNQGQQPVQSPDIQTVKKDQFEFEPQTPEEQTQIETEIQAQRKNRGLDRIASMIINGQGITSKRDRQLYEKNRDYIDRRVAEANNPPAAPGSTDRKIQFQREKAQAGFDAQSVEPGLPVDQLARQRQQEVIDRTNIDALNEQDRVRTAAQQEIENNNRVRAQYAQEAADRKKRMEEIDRQRQDADARYRSEPVPDRRQYWKNLKQQLDLDYESEDAAMQEAVRQQGLIPRFTPGNQAQEVQDGLQEGQRETEGQIIPPLRPNPIVDNSPASYPAPGERWDADPGATPGQPAFILDNGKAAIIEQESGNNGEKLLFEAMLDGGQSLGVFETIDQAAKAAEVAVDNFEQRPTSPMGDRRATPRATTDRRQDTIFRKKVDEMTPEERKFVLHTDELTALPNKRKFDEDYEASKPEAVARLDMDNLHSINKWLSYEGADQVVRDIGRVAQEEGISIYREKGDEFIAMGTGESLESAMKRLTDRLSEATFEYEAPDGQKYIFTKGIGVSYGTGNTLQEAEQNQTRSKQQRSAQGRRAEEGDRSGTVIGLAQRFTPRGQADNQNTPQERPSRVSSSGAATAAQPVISKREKATAAYHEYVASLTDTQREQVKDLIVETPKMPSIQAQRIRRALADIEATAEQSPARRAGTAKEAPKTDRRLAIRVRRLRDTANRLKESAEEKYNQGRNENTARRARMAASARSTAAKDIQIAETMLKIADGIESGDLKHLNGVSAKAHVESIDRIAETAHRDHIGKKYNSYADQKAHYEDPLTEDLIPYIEYPTSPSIGPSERGAISRFMNGKRGIGEIRSILEQPITYDRANKILSLAKKHGFLKELNWSFEDKIKRINQLKSIGINNTDQLMKAVKEYVELRSGKKQEDPIKALERELIGQKVGIDFFPTPKTIAKQMVERADIQDGMSVLEPSAGKGDIADVIKEETGVVPDVVEVSSTLRKLLEAKGYELAGSDFLDMTGEYDRIIMNPPFSKNQDIKHVRHAYGMLKPGGRVVAIMSEHGFFASDKESAAFREWLEENGMSEKLPEGSFKGKEAFNQTGVNSRLVVFDKAAAEKKSSKPNSKTERKSNGPQTLRGRIKQAGGIDFLNFKGEQKNLPTAVKFLSNKNGIPIDLLEQTLKDEGWLDQNENLIDILTDSEVLKRGKVVSDGTDTKTKYQEEQERKLLESANYEAEEPPPGEYIEMNAEDLPTGKKLTIIDGNGRDGWDEYTVLPDDDPFTVTLQDGIKVELGPLDKVQVLKKDLPKDTSKAKQADIVEEPVTLFDEQVQKPPKTKKEKSSKSDQEQKDMFGYNQADMFGSRSAGTMQTKKSGQIDDFGEKIGGARKDLYAAYQDKMADAKDVDIVTAPLSQSWPEPDYQQLIDNGVDKWAVGFIRAARDEVPRKPAKSWKKARWASNVEMLRDFATKIIDGTHTKERLQELLKKDEYAILRTNVASRAELYELVGHERSLKGVKFSKNHYSVYRGERNIDKWEVTKDRAATLFSNMPRVLGIGNTKQEMLDDFKSRISELDTPEKKTRSVRFDLYNKRGESGVWIGKKLGRNYIDLKQFDTASEAREYLKENKSELEDLLKKYTTVPNERREVNRERIGKDHRNGKDVTPELFTETFGFRGVEFGNWVNSKERQSNLNSAYDALLDLANILDIPSQAISLNGELGLAFGARGSGGKRAPSAHYEPLKIAINLTRKNGPGSMAHEWWHALDSYFSRRRGSKLGYLSETPRRLNQEDTTRQEMIDAFKGVMDAIKSTKLEKRSTALDSRRSKRYWSTGVEMSARAFEHYVIEKIASENGVNDYLANIASPDAYAADMVEALVKNENLTAMDFYPYLLDNEIKTISNAYDSFFETIEVEDGKTLYKIDGDQETTPQIISNISKASSIVIDALNDSGLGKDVLNRIGLELKPAIDAGGRNTNQTVKQWSSQGKTISSILGATTIDNMSALIEISTKQDLDTMEKTTYHEAFHVAAAWVLPPSEYQKLMDFFDGNEELTADAFADYMVDEKSSKRVYGTVRHILKKLKDLITRIRSALSRKGFTSPEDIFGKLASGQYKKRNTGMYQGRALKEEERAPVWYSQMEKVLESKLPLSGTPESFKDMIHAWAKKGEFKSDELEWSGLLDWLESKGISPKNSLTANWNNAGQKITKQEVLDYLRVNNVRVDEVVKGRRTKEQSQLLINKRNEIYSQYDNGEISRDERNRLLEQADEDINPSDIQLGQEKYSQYQLPGGKNYKELLLTLPERNQELPDGFKAVQKSENKWIIDGPGPLSENRYGSGSTRQEAVDSFKKHGHTGGYKSSHWDEPNVLAHVRFNERTDSNGRKVLFIEEVQSDYGQDYRKQLNNIEKAVENNFKDIVKSMEKAGVLKEIC